MPNANALTPQPAAKLTPVWLEGIDSQFTQISVALTDGCATDVQH